MEQYWDRICPINENLKQFLPFYNTSSSPLPNDIKKVVQSLERVVDMLLGFKDAYKEKPVGISHCKYVLENELY